MTHEVYNIDLNKRLTNKEIICYFNNLVNDNKLISTKRYDLEINDDSNYNDFNRIVKYSNNRYYFNQHLLITKFFTQNRNKDINNVDINLEIFEKLHEIIAEIELRRMVDDNITYKIDPLYYVYLVKEYIDGPTIYELVKDDAMDDSYIIQVREMAQRAYSFGLNIDYFPTNFVVADVFIFYIDYECNSYMDDWDFENWGINYWSKTKAFLEYMKKH